MRGRGGSLSGESVMSDAISEIFGLEPDAPHRDEALTHPSHANEARTPTHYQRLEFLGDAVLGLCTSELLCARFADADEGALTRMRAKLVNADALARWARKHGVPEAVRLGRGAETGGLRDSTNVLADVVEALIGASYLDVGLDAARKAVATIVGPDMKTFTAGDARDAKSELQERVQRAGAPPPSYAVVESGGPSHEPWFVVEVSVGEQAVGRGRGRSKRQAERAAAAAALNNPTAPLGGAGDAPGTTETDKEDER